MSDAYDYAVSIRDGVERFELALGGDVEAVRALLAGEGHDVDELWAELWDGDEPTDDEVSAECADMLREALDEWPLEVRPTFSGWRCGADDLWELALVVTTGGPHCEVEVGGSSSVTVRVWWGGDVGVATLSAPAFSDYWWELAQAQVEAHKACH
jgi:hypothetical protein